jgi:hypothetical protein
MSKLLKSKFLIGVMTLAIMFVGVVAVNATTTLAASCSLGTTTLRVGSKGQAVVCLQATLDHGLVGDGSFGPKTKAEVVAFQTANGLTADGVVGPKSKAVLSGGAVSGNFLPPGCTSASGYSSVTGGACYAVPSNLPAGCTSTAGFSSTTGASCATGTVITTTYPAGCTSASGFSPTTGASCATGAVNNQTGPVSVSLAANNPASGYIIANQATADLAHFAFTGNGTINSLTLQRTGVSDQNTLTNVYLYDGATRLTDGFSFNNVGQLTMNGLGIAVNGSRIISVKADVANVFNASSLGITLTSFTASGQAATTVNVMGNTMTYGVGNLASVYMATQASAAAPSLNATVNAGTSAFTLWSAPVQVNTRAVWLKGANFRLIGSAPADALGNIHLFVDGVSTGAAATMGTITGSNYAMFDFSAMPITLSTGTHTVDLRADIIKGSSYTVQASIQQAADLVLYDAQVGVNIAPSVSSMVAFTSNNANAVTINAGTASVVIDPTFSAMTNITGGATNVDIAKFKVHGYGEDVKVSTLSVTPNIINATAGGCTTNGTGGVIGGTCGLSNVAVYFNGSQVGSSVNWTQASGPISFNLGSQMILPAGTDSYIEIRSDLQTTGSVNYTIGTVSATLNTGSSNGQGQSSHTTLNFPTSGVVGTSLTVQTGLLAVSSNGAYSSQSANPNTAGVKIGSFTLQNQSSSESVNVTGLNVALAFAAPTFTSSNTYTASTQTWTLSSASGITVGNVITPTTVTGTGGTGGTMVMTVVSISGATVTGTVVNTGTPSAASGAILGSGVTSGPATLTNFSNLRTSETSGSGSTPIQPSTNNTFSVNFTLAPGATNVIDVLADTSTANMGTVVSSLTVTSLGGNSHVSISQNGIATPVGGQTITLASGAVTNPPTLVTSSSTAAQLVPAANGGAVNATKAEFNFASTGGASTITELKFTVASATTGSSVSVNGVTAPFVSGVAYLTGLNLAVPFGGSGLNQDVFVSYPEVGISGIASTTASALSLTYVKYTSGGTTATFTPNVPAPTMVLVGSKPTYTVTDVNSQLVNGQVELGDITVAADAKGDIKVSQIAISTSSTNGPVITAAIDDIIVKDSNNVVIATTNTSFGMTSNTTGTANICFDASAAGCTGTQTTAAGYLIPAGTSKTFRIYATVASGVSGAVGTNSLSTTLGVNTSTKWYDVAGNNTTAINAASVFNYPTNTSVITN